LKKDNLLSSDPAMQSAISRVFGPDAAPASEGIVAKLEHRLLSSKALSREVIMVISSLSSTLKPRQDNGTDAEEESGRPPTLQKAKRPGVDEHHRATPEGPESNTEHSTVDRSTPSETGALGAVSVPDQGLGDSGDSGDDTSSSGSRTSDDPLPPRTSVLPSRTYSSSDRASYSPLRSDEASKSLGTNSTFLPTLLNGFIPGGSDTDWSDGGAKVADSTRKNRRGQRARRA
jgi:BUD22